MKKSLIFIILIFILSIFSSCNNKNELDNDSTLSKILINDEEIKDFDKHTLSYEITIPYIKEIVVEGIPTSNKAVVDGNNTIIVNEDKDIYSIVLTCIAEDQSKTNYYISINILNEQKSSNCDLESLMIDDILIDGFNKDILNYDINLEEGKEVNITAVLADDKASVINVGKYNIDESKTINIIVTAEDGTTKTYNINFIIDVEISKPTLENILIDDVPLADFEEDKYVYSFSATSTKVKVSAVYNSDYKVSGEGEYEIAKGKVTLIPLIVKNGSLETKYVINVSGPKLDDDATLKELKIDGNNINLTLGKYEYSYDLYDKKEFNISAVANSNLAKIDGVGNFILDINTKTYNIVVKAEDGTTLTYKITINYKESTANLEIKYCEGLNETIAIEYVGNNNLNISYKEENDSTYKDVDKELIRNMGSYIRVDIVGLKQGNYSVKIGNNILNDIIVYPYDRSGYAFFNYDDGVGAYNNDGTLKDDALVIYVSDATKNSVTARINNKEYSGLVKILQNAKGSNVPIVIRVLDSLKTNQWAVKDDAPRLYDNSNYNDEQLKDYYTNVYETIYGTNLVGLKSRIMIDGLSTFEYETIEDGIKLVKTTSRSLGDPKTYNKDKYSDIKGKKVHDDDSYNNMLDIEGASNLTIEGIGTNAEFFQFGLTFKKCNSIEVRNITFTNTTEDACSFEGASGHETEYSNYFIHHNTFNRGKNNWDISGERDKAEGDGSMDFKYLNGVTISYNLYNNPHKTSLVGGSDNNIQYNITYHHNYYNEVESRLPLGRQANMHIYNNYFYKVSSSSVDLRAGAYAFLEGNYFEDSKLPRTRKEEKDGYNLACIKSYNDYADSNCSEPNSKDYNKWQVVTNRTTSITSNCQILGINYSNFDTNSELFYYKNGMSDVMILTDASKAKEDCINYAGVLKEGQNSTIFS